jgi:hypothetical protein
LQDDDNLSLPSRRSDPYKAKKSWQARIGPLARSQLRRFPLIEAPVRKTWRSVKQGFFGCKWELQALTGSLRGTYASGIDVDKTRWVSPQRIVFSSLQEFNFRDFRGHIIGGDWDRLDKKFDDLDVCVAFKQVCQEGKGWAETVFYQRVLGELNAGHVLWSCKDQRDLEQRCKSLESLFHSIQCEGYKSQRELFLAGRIQDPLEAEEEVTVSIGRHGDLLFCDGAHRLAIAKLLGVPRIPVKVAVRHPKWIKLRDELLHYAQEEGGKIYQPITHPDLDDIAAFHDCEDRFRLIKENMSVTSGRLLDIGAYLGYFCHRFEDEGFDCYAIEDDPMRVYFLERLARAENRKFKTIAGSVLDCREIRNVHFTVVLALNIFHHFLKTPERYEKFIDLLKNLQTDELFFESHLADETQMQDAYKNYSPDEFVKLIMRNSNLKKADLIGTMKDGRPLYKLY